MRIVGFAILLSTLDAAAPDTRLAQSYLSLPISFARRADSYDARGLNYAVAVDAMGATMQLAGAPLRMRLAGADSCANLTALDPLPGKVNYIFGRDVRRSQTLFRRVSCRSPYPGIDLIFHGSQGQLEYDFVIAPGRKPETIALAFSGADELSLDGGGSLLIRAGNSQIRQARPVAYQTIGGRNVRVAVEYWIDASRYVHFRLGRYDGRYRLVIDPVILFHTQFGGSSNNFAAAVTLDAQGNAYIAGITNSADFTTSNAEQNQIGNAPLLLSSNGGGSWMFPSFPAAAAGPIAVAPSNSSIAYAAGGTGIVRSSDGGRSWTATASKGLAPPLYTIAVDPQDSAKLYAGGVSGLAFSLDAGKSWTGSSFAGLAGSSNYVNLVVPHPTKAGTLFAASQSPYALYRSSDYGQSWTKLNPQLASGVVAAPMALLFDPRNPDVVIMGERSGALQTSLDGGDTWSFLGPREVDGPQSIAMDAGDPDTLYLTDGFGLEKSSDGGRSWRVVLAMTNQTAPTPVAADPNRAGLAFVIGNQGLFRTVDKGETWTPVALPYPLFVVNWLTVTPGSSNLLIAASTNQDVFVTKWDPKGGQLLYSTFLGGSINETATGIAVDAAGNAYVAGFTNSANFPLTPGAFQSTLAGTQNAFVTKLSPDGSKLIYSTLLGGGGELTGGIVVDAAGAAYVTGSTRGSFPLTANAAQKSTQGTCINPTPYYNYPLSGDAFVTKINADGASLGYSTLLGGACGESGYGIALDANGGVWVTGNTFSSDFPVTAGALQPKYGGGFGDGFLVRYTKDGSLSYATYVGGSSYDDLRALALDAAGNIYLTGSGLGFTQPPSAGAFQPKPNAVCLVSSIGPPLFNTQGNAFVMKLDPAAANVVGLTYYGAPCIVTGQSIAVDAQGAAWIAGFTDSKTLPTAGPFQFGGGTGFLAKFSSDLTQLEFATYLPSVGAVALDPSGAAIFVGGEAPAGTTGQSTRAYLAKLDAVPSAVSLDQFASLNPSVLPFLATPLIVPGKVIRITGHGLGPAATTPGVTTPQGLVATSVAGVKATFNGIAAPLLSVSSAEIQCVVPFELLGLASATVQVEYNGLKSNAVLTPVDAMGVDVLAVLNEDFTINATTNPAKAGSVVTLYLTGLGQTNPPSLDGQVNRPPLAQLTAPLKVGFGNDPPLEVTYAGAAQGLVAGVVQVNFRAPAKTAVNLNVRSGLGATFDTIAYFTVFVE